MLLDEVQKQHAEIADLPARLERIEALLGLPGATPQRDLDDAAR